MKFHNARIPARLGNSRVNLLRKIRKKVNYVRKHENSR